MKPFVEDGRVWFDREAYEAIASTPNDDCYICTRLLRETTFDPLHKKLYSISRKWLFNNYFEEHLSQIIGDWKETSKEKVEFT